MTFQTCSELGLRDCVPAVSPFILASLTLSSSLCLSPFLAPSLLLPLSLHPLHLLTARSEIDPDNPQQDPDGRRLFEGMLQALSDVREGGREGREGERERKGGRGGRKREGERGKEGEKERGRELKGGWEDGREGGR